MSRVIEILPFGVLPIVAFFAYAAWGRTHDKVQARVGANHRKGITEYPTAISTILCGCGNDEIRFVNSGRSVQLTLHTVDRNLDIDNHAEVADYLRVRIDSNDVDDRFVRNHVIESVTRDRTNGFINVTITMPEEVVRTEDYVAHELKNLGRVFMRNLSNHERWLLPADGGQIVSTQTGCISFSINRSQEVPSFMEHWKRIVMSEHQITRNMKNRLWNRANVRCIGIDESTYRGEITF